MSTQPSLQSTTPSDSTAATQSIMSDATQDPAAPRDHIDELRSLNMDTEIGEWRAQIFTNAGWPLVTSLADSLPEGFCFVIHKGSPNPLAYSAWLCADSGPRERGYLFQHHYRVRTAYEDGTDEKQLYPVFDKIYNHLILLDAAGEADPCVERIEGKQREANAVYFRVKKKQ